MIVMKDEAFILSKEIDVVIPIRTSVFRKMTKIAKLLKNRNYVHWIIHEERQLH